MVEFNGWEMPLEYSGVVHEHEAVRNAAGLFDVGHMGCIEVGGPDGLRFLERVITFRPDSLGVDRARYAFLLNDKGGIKDDLMVFRLTEDRFLLVVNASNREKDMAWLREQDKAFGAVLIDDSPDTCILALQGPKSWEIARETLGIDPAAIKYHGLANSQFDGTGYIISRTGYTGEKGFEIYIHRHAAVKLWDTLLDVGKSHGLVPCGLGARDTLRLEMGYLLYGNDIDESTNPIEAGYESAIDFGNESFIGRGPVKTAADGLTGRKLTALALVGRGIPRRGDLIRSSGMEAGVVTSGNFSPMTKKGIALGYIKAATGFEDITIDVHGRKLEAEVVELPFYKRTK